MQLDTCMQDDPELHFYIYTYLFQIRCAPRDTYRNGHSSIIVIIAKDWVQGFINNRIDKCGMHVYNGVLHGNENELTALK